MSFRKNKALAVIDLLSKKEEKLFKGVIRNHKRKTLLPMFNFLKKCLLKEVEIDTKVLYKVAFRAVYTEEKDYLLRNELRILTTELTNFLVIEKLKRDIAEDTLLEKLHFLELLHQRSEYDLLEQELKKVLKAAIKKNNYPITAKLLALEVQFLIAKKTVTQAHYNELLNRIALAATWQKKAFLVDFLKLDKLRAYTERNLKVFDHNYKVAPFNENVLTKYNFIELRDVYLSFLQIDVDIYSKPEVEKLKLLDKALSILPEINYDADIQKQERTKLYAQIGLSHLLLDNNVAAIKAFEQIMENDVHLLSEHAMLSTTFNYISVLVKNKNYTKAIGIILQYENSFPLGSFLHFRLLAIKAMCYLFINKIEEAEVCLPENLKDSTTLDYLYFRLILIVIYYARDELALALNEVNNFNYVLNYNKPADDTFKKLALLYTRFFRLQLNTVVEVNYEDKMQLLRKDLSVFIDNDARHRILPAYYLLEELKKRK